MTRTSLRVAAATMLLTAAAALPAHAQVSSPIKFNVRAGASVPVGDFGDAASTGFVIGGGLTLRAPLMPVALRVDGDYNRWAGDEDLFGPDVNVSLWSITANAQMAPALSPIYFIGGVGLYSANDESTDETSTDFGLNGGAGLRLPLTGFSTFVEARFHSVFIGDGASNNNYIPITFGIEF